jgi:Ribonuclease G/E
MPRTDEENLALRARISVDANKPPTPAGRLRELLAHPDLRDVYRRIARRALESGDEEAIASEIRQMEREVARAEASAAQLKALFPTLYPCLQVISKPRRLRSPW